MPGRVAAVLASVLPVPLSRVRGAVAGGFVVASSLLIHVWLSSIVPAFALDVDVYHDATRMALRAGDGTHRCTG